MDGGPPGRGVDGFEAAADQKLAQAAVLPVRRDEGRVLQRARAREVGPEVILEPSVEKSAATAEGGDQGDAQGFPAWSNVPEGAESTPQEVSGVASLH